MTQPDPFPKGDVEIFDIPWIIAALIAVCVLIELLLQAIGFGLLDGSRTRVYHFVAFWSGVLRDWPPNYAAQPVTMFVTYGFFHAGFFHLLVNMITLWSVGPILVDRVGTFRFLVLYFASMVGGAAAFGLLAEKLLPMVGASGALFGLAGAFLSWNYVDRFATGLNLWPIARVIGLLIAMNVVLFIATGGQLAWETHLGGFVTGWVTALLLDPRSQAL